MHTGEIDKIASAYKVTPECVLTIKDGSSTWCNHLKSTLEILSNKAKE